MHIIADLGRCVGAGQCVLTDPTIFDQNDEDGTVVVLNDHPEDRETSERVREAVHVCPSSALSLEE
jgi:ferredoxin